MTPIRRAYSRQRLFAYRCHLRQLLRDAADKRGWAVFYVIVVVGLGVVWVWGKKGERNADCS